jgi:hypothetical protein
MFADSYSIIEKDSFYMSIGKAVTSLTKGCLNLILYQIDKQNGSILNTNLLVDTLSSYYPRFHSTIKLKNGGFLMAATKQYHNAAGPAYGILIKFDDNFDTLWTKEYPDWDSIRPSDTYPSFANRMYAVKELPTGEFLCVGDYFRGEFGAYDGYVVKTDSIGNYMWHKPLTSFNPEIIELGDSGSFYLIGPGPGLKITKFDSLGNQLWQQAHFITDTMFAPSQAAQTIDSCFVIAYSKSYKVLGSDIYSWIRVIKVDKKDGQIVWSKYFRHNVTNMVYGIIQLPDSGLLIYGESRYYNQWDPTLTKEYGLLLKLSADGDSLWSRIIQRRDSCQNDMQSFYDIQTTDDKGFVATGYYADPFLHYSTSWFVKMDSLGCTDPNCLDTLIGGVEMQQFKEDYLVVNPNPVHDKLTIGMNVPSLAIEEIQIFDIHGRLVHQQKIHSPSCQIDVQPFKPGIYLLQVRDRNGVVSTKKFVKE